eukprot:5667342-Pyramimonas_sp.AAC.1
MIARVRERERPSDRERERTRDRHLWRTKHNIVRSPPQMRTRGAVGTSAVCETLEKPAAGAK